MDTKIIEKNDTKLAIDALKKGEIIAFKTDTIFGFSCVASNKKSCAVLQEIKHRENKPFIVLLGDDMDINQYVKNISEKANKIIKHFWPGPLTIIFEKKFDFCDEITCGKNTVGIRVPKNDLTQELIKGVGEPIVSTSVNISGERFLNSEDEILKAFNGKISYIIKDDSKRDVSSTIISCVQNIEILREGCVKKEEIIEFIKNI